MASVVTTNPTGSSSSFSQILFRSLRRAGEMPSVPTQVSGRPKMTWLGSAVFSGESFPKATVREASTASIRISVDEPSQSWVEPTATREVASCLTVQIAVLTNSSSIWTAKNSWGSCSGFPLSFFKKDESSINSAFARANVFVFIKFEAAQQAGVFDMWSAANLFTNYTSFLTTNSIDVYLSRVTFSEERQGALIFGFFQGCGLE